jgi:hypothetical protein
MPPTERLTWTNTPGKDTSSAFLVHSEDINSAFGDTPGLIFRIQIPRRTRVDMTPAVGLPRADRFTLAGSRGCALRTGIRHQFSTSVR